MRWLRSILREIFGLFVDDGSFTIAIMVWLAMFWWALPYLPLSVAWDGPILFGGLVAILIGNAFVRARQG